MLRKATQKWKDGANNKRVADLMEK